MVLEDHSSFFHRLKTNNCLTTPPTAPLTEEELLFDAVSLQELQHGHGPGDGGERPPHPGRVLRHERLREEGARVVRVWLAADDGASTTQQLLKAVRKDCQTGIA